MVIHFKDEYERAGLLTAANVFDQPNANGNGNSAEKLDFSEPVECAYCKKEESKCAKSGWTDRIIDKSNGVSYFDILNLTDVYTISKSVAPGHRLMCEQNKEQMSKVSIFQTILQQFPWARIENDGTFRYRIVLASRGLLGNGREFGFWSEEPCCNEHGLDTFEWGTSLMQSNHLDEKTGWKLPDDEIPWLTFDENSSGSHKPPTFPPSFEDNWKSYYEWRGLPLTSTAALLLHWPLSIYRILEKLKLTPSGERRSVNGERKSLLVHYIGAEEELDYLPIFGELALLLPNTDLELIFFGESPYMLLHSGRQLGSSDSILSKSQTNDDGVYTYTAPTALGGGSIRIILWGGGLAWTPEVLRFGAPFPDALIGLNAGLSVYQDWQSVIVSSRAYGIPFGITEFMEASGELNRGLVTNLTVELPEDASEWMKETYGEGGAANLRIRHEMECDVNPFMKPGQKTGAPWSRLPAALNGFTFIVTPFIERVVPPVSNGN
ncbi:hypothetical protein Clacol_008069 [Clathrus columnatus]|uniref:Mitochondrial splicing suppressor 51-like C-terminal domain-containing protein n=1 Tax=Clathrus columnatus TaxID=1419009 RepID=A0AAV5AJE2_9AGAM|nr:hypothetical protein Clacol_008069 [Clathrus columnatus]